ncbi:MAG: DUF4493 domain-containing protein, partial [Muribaculaceae bacterium]|nr:DUF4493 domain-containing protein [Muribaculaceae bacterium]
VSATKGADVEAEWESPYFVGSSDEFEIKEDEIMSDLDPIVCRLQNVKVSVDFAPMLSGNMSPDSYVEVKVGDNAGLQFTKEHEGMAGHFRHGATLVATFNGEVEGLPVVETKSINNVQKGHHYKITFKLHSQSDNHYGEADASVGVEASVTTVDLEYNVVIGEDEDLGDEERPKEDDQPVTPPATGDTPPTIVAQAPIDLEKVNVIKDGMECVLNVTSTSEGGFTKFECDIDSPKLTPDELSNVGLASHLDLINPGNLREPLTNLGLLNGEVKGSKQVKFDLTGFLPLITILGPAEHKFILTVGDANGETTKTLILKQN